jgi:putative ABC transport system permease protein
MSTTLLERPVAPARLEGGAPARRAMIRWAFRLFRREWRRQALILALLVLAVAATTVGLGVAANATNLSADPVFGTANTIITVPGSDPKLAADVATIQRRVGTSDVIEHQNVDVAGSVATIDLRAQNPAGHYGRVMLRLDSGRFPTGAGEVAITSGVERTFDLRVGSVWSEGGRRLRVVGVVENPLDLLDQFALVAPGQASPPTSVAILADASQSTLQSFRLGIGLGIAGRGGDNKTAGEVIVLVLGTVGLLFVGLMAVAGFTVMAHRRLRALGMLGSLGATDRNVRMVMLANGAAVGGTAAVLGTVVGILAWLAFVPTLESLAEHRVDRFALPWWAVGAAMALTFITAVAAAWWPARAVVRIPVVAALSGRPPRPQPAHRFAALGGVLLATGLVLLAFADQNRTWFIIGGTVITVFGILFLAPLAIQAIAAVAGRSRVSVRLALRDLARFQARSGAALGAITLAIGIAVTIVVSAAAAQTPGLKGNLPNDELVLYLSRGGGGNPIPPVTAAQTQSLQARIGRLSAAIHGRDTVPLEEAYDPTSGVTAPAGGSGQGVAGYLTVAVAHVNVSPHGQQVTFIGTLYVATADVLAHYGINPSQVDPTAEVVTSSTALSGVQLFDPGGNPPGPGTKGPGGLATNGARGPQQLPPAEAHPRIQVLKQLPAYGSEPMTLITRHAMQSLGLVAVPSGWLLQTAHPLTVADIDTARNTAASAGMFVETRSAPKSSAPLKNWSTTVGILLALGVLAMTVGLIRSETAGDLRTLAAAGAGSTARRSLTGATAGALALLGAILGSAGAYAALLAWHRSDLNPLGRVPVANLIIIVAGLPVIAAVGGWLLAGREPPAIGRQPIE